MEVKKDIIRKYLYNELHCDDGPAVVYANGQKEWYQFGKLHRLDGPAIECVSIKEYWEYGKRHRLNGPAVIKYDNIRYWYQFGKLHRENGPAIENTRDSNHTHYYLNGEYYKKKILENFLN